MNPERLREFVRACLLTTGMPDDPASVTAAALATSDTMGVFTHGTKLLSGYIRRLQGGGYQATATPTVERDGPAWAVLNGHHCLGQVSCMQAVQLGMEKARTCGIAFIGVRDTGHIGAAGYYAQYAARAGFVTMVTGNDMPSVAAPGSRKAILGSNPLAWAAPNANGHPLLLDIATAAVAGGKVYAAIARGESLPDTWLIGPDGHPTTDGTLYPHHAALAPMAGHKGYGIGMWCEFLAGLLPGGCITWQIGSWIFDEPNEPSRHNAGLILIDANTIGGDRYQQQLDQFIEELHNAPPAEGTNGLLLPGEREWQHHDNAIANGLTLPSDVIEKLQLCSKMTGVPLPEL
jgi:ureidoglycolate dehydrogenase (NAD+)